MNPEWNTPPNGDFARYVERLSAQAALPGSSAYQGEHGLDVGMTPTSDSKASTAAANVAAQRRASSSGNEGSAGQVTPESVIFKALAAIGAVVLLGMWAAGVPPGLLVVFAVGGVWLAFKLKRLQLPALGSGVAKWQQVLETAAREQREKQKQRQGQ